MDETLVPESDTPTKAVPDAPDPAFQSTRRDFLRCVSRSLIGGAVVGHGLWRSPAAVAAPSDTVHTIKFACVAPEGSLWVKLTRDWDLELRRRSQQQARMQLLPGGTAGEEIDVIRKMRVGRIHATGVTGIGMGEMVPSTRLIELPRLVQSERELDALTSGLEAYYKAEFLQRGYVFLGFTEVGPIHLFSTRPIRRLADLESTRMWLWEHDPVSEEISRVFGISGVPLNLLSVKASLETNVIHGVYGSPLATMTMQWNAHVQYMTTPPLSYAVGVMVMDRKAFEALPPHIQSLQLELGKTYARKMVEQSRIDNAASLKLMESRGMKVVSFDPAEVEIFNSRAVQVGENLKGRLFTEATLRKAQVLVLSARAGGGSR